MREREELNPQNTIACEKKDPIGTANARTILNRRYSLTRMFQTNDGVAVTMWAILSSSDIYVGDYGRAEEGLQMRVAA